MKRNQYINILRTLEGIKEALKVAHWNETESMNRHQQLDEFYDKISEFQDAFAEDLSKDFGMISYEEFSSKEIRFRSLKELVDKIYICVQNIKNILANCDSPSFAGMNGLADGLVNDTKIFVYRMQMI